MELPLGWAEAPLGEICKPKYGKSLPKDKRDNSAHIPVVGSAGIMTCTATALVEDPCLVIGRKGNIGQVQLFDTPCWPIDTTFFVQPPRILDPRFLKYALSTVNFGALNRSTTTPSLRREELENISILLPPIPEQFRIIEALEGHLSRLGVADVSMRLAIARTSNLISNSHVSALSRMANAESVKIGEIAKVGSGATPLRGKAQYYDAGTIPWATSGDLHAGDIFDVRGRITEVALQETAVKLWPAGTLLVAMYGEGKTRGTVAELHIASTTNQACAAIVFHPEFVDLRRWVRFILRTRYDEMRSQASGGVQPNLSLGRIKDISIPIPDVEVRAAILAEDADSSESVDRLRLAGKRSLARSAALRRSLLRAAFSGELVDQDPADEPAGVALARLNGEQATAVPPRRRRKTVAAK